MGDKISDKPVIALAVIILAIIVIGEAVVYTSDYTDYSAEVSFSGGDLTYSVSADGSKEYDVVIMDNGSYGNVSKLYLYYDTSYPTDYKEATVPVGAKELDQEYYLEQMLYLLEYRNFHNVEYVDAEGLRDVMESSPEGVGILVTSGVLPDTVYTGSEDDPIFKWIQSGGSLYWVGNLIGQSYATAEGDIVPVDGYQQLFFGADCLNTGETAGAYSEIGNGFREALSLSNNRVEYAVNPDLLPEGTIYQTAGYTEDGFASISLVGLGSGMVCVLGGDYSRYQMADLAQTIAAGLGPMSKIVETASGEVTRGTETGTISGIPDGNLSAYVYLGGYYPVFGKHFNL